MTQALDLPEKPRTYTDAPITELVALPCSLHIETRPFTWLYWKAWFRGTNGLQEYTHSGGDAIGELVVELVRFFRDYEAKTMKYRNENRGLIEENAKLKAEAHHLRLQVEGLTASKKAEENGTKLSKHTGRPKDMPR